LLDSFRAGPGLRSILVLLSTNLYDIYQCRFTVNKLLMMGRGTSETCRVSCRNKFGKLVHLGWFYYKEICYDARSHESKFHNGNGHPLFRTNNLALRIST